MGVDETLLHEIVRRVLTVAQPDKIILFGSAATGQMTRDSDIDLLVVDREPDNRHEMSVRIRSAIGNIDYPVRPLDPSLAHLLSGWVRKTGGDLKTATWLSREGDQFRDAITFHCQQAQLRYHL